MSTENTQHDILLPQETQPLISVIVRTQNRPHLLKRALNSIAAQTYTQIEIIVVNDGGENVQTIVESFDNAQLIQNETAQGRAIAANVGLEKATGTWIAFLDDDDIFEQDGLEKLAHFIAWDKNVIYGQVQLLHMHNDPDKIEKKGLFGETFNPERLFLQNYIPICAYICKRELALNIKGFDPDFQFLEDWDFLVRLSQQTTFHYIPELVSNYCVWGEAYVTGRDKDQEMKYRTLFFQKHRDLMTPEVLQKASLTLLETLNNKNDEVSQRYENHINNLQNIHTHDQTQLKNHHQSELETLKAQHATVIHEFNITHEQAIEQLKTEHRLTTEHLNNKHEITINELKKQHGRESTEALSTWQHEQEKWQEKWQREEEKLTQRIEQIAETNKKLSRLNDEVNHTVAALKAELDQAYIEQDNCHHALQHTQAHSHEIQTRLGQIEVELTHTKKQSKDRIQQLIWRLSSHIAFTSENLLDLSHYGLTPASRIFSAEQNSTKDIISILEGEIQAPIPILRGKILKWEMAWYGVESTQVILLKLGTYDRINQCHLQLTIFDAENDTEQQPVATAYLDGTTVKNNSYVAFLLDKPLKIGHYICELTSPDSDNVQNALCIWLTTAYKKVGGEIAKNYRYYALETTTMPALDYQPTISILMPTYNTPKHFLKACIESVVNQIYPHWELCIADDASTKSHVHEILQSYQQRFPDKIKVTYREKNGHISASSNSALTLCTGEFVALLDHDDLLTPDALLEVAKALNHHADKTIDLLYSDEDKLDETGQFDEPFFKPDWSPENLRGQMYIGHLGVYRTAIMKEIGGFRVGYEGSQDWDLALRFTEKTQNIHHIPKILYHWRKHSGSTAQNTQQKEYAVQMGLKVVQEALDREGAKGQAEFNQDSNCLLVHYPVVDDPLVSIIIPTRDMADILEVCLASFVKTFDHPRWEIVIVDNDSQEEKTFELFKEYEKLLGKDRFKVCRQVVPFNFSYLVNQGVKFAKGEIILLLNNDTQLLEPANWLTEMVGYVQREEVGCIGAKLLYPDNTIQHAGVICGIGGVANHAHLHLPANSPGYFSRLTIVSNYAAVTGACLMVRREIWDEVDGFDETLAVAFNDIDFCLKVLEKGYRNIVLPHVTFYHHESKSRGKEDTPEKQRRFTGEVHKMQARWQPILDNDPYYNANLNKKFGDFNVDSNAIYYCDEIEEELQ